MTSGTPFGSSVGPPKWNVMRVTTPASLSPSGSALIVSFGGSSAKTEAATSASEMMNRAMRVVAIIGESNSGKTTLICGLIRHFVTRGKTVAAIKHTHHPLTEERRGDTEAFLRAGAKAAILAGDREAIRFDQGDRIRYDSPRDLLQGIDADLVFVEGFKHYDGWPRIDAATTRTVDEALAVLDTIA